MNTTQFIIVVKGRSIYGGRTCFAAEDNQKLVGFVLGFLSQTNLDEAYIRIVMVHPDYRRNGAASALYEQFFEKTEQCGRHIVSCVTSPNNKASIAFHQRLGFMIEPQVQEVDGLPVCANYDGCGGNRVVFKKKL